MLKKAPISAWFGMIVILIYAFVALFAPIIAPYGEGEVLGDAYRPWTAAHPVGTDQLGRDMLTRLIYGARNTIGIAFVTMLLSFMIGGVARHHGGDLPGLARPGHWPRSSTP